MYKLHDIYISTYIHTRAHIHSRDFETKDEENEQHAKIPLLHTTRPFIKRRFRACVSSVTHNNLFPSLSSPPAVRPSSFVFATRRNFNKASFCWVQSVLDFCAVFFPFLLFAIVFTINLHSVSRVSVVADNKPDVIESYSALKWLKSNYFYYCIKLGFSLISNEHCTVIWYVY
jgi:hypothetical protein